MVEFRLLGGCVRVKSECNTTFPHLKHIAQIQSKFVNPSRFQQGKSISVPESYQNNYNEAELRNQTVCKSVKISAR